MASWRWTGKRFAASFAGDVEEEKAEFMANSRVPWGVQALQGVVSSPAWKNKPSWYLVDNRGSDDSPAGPAFDGQASGANVQEDTYAADVAELAAHLDLRNAIHVGQAGSSLSRAASTQPAAPPPTTTTSTSWGKLPSSASVLNLRCPELTDQFI